MGAPDIERSSDPKPLSDFESRSEGVAFFREQKEQLRILLSEMPADDPGTSHVLLQIIQCHTFINFLLLNIRNRTYSDSADGVLDRHELSESAIAA